MTTLQEIQEELKTAKKRLKFAQACELAINTFNNRSQFDYDNPYRDRVETLFYGRDTIFSCGSFSLQSSDINHYEEMHEIHFGAKPESTKEIKKALKFIEKFKEENGDILYNMIKDL